MAGAGKSTIRRLVAKHSSKSLFVQVDEIAQLLKGAVFFDGGIPEWLRWLPFLETSAQTNILAAKQCRYPDTVFVAEPWPEIYVCDHYRQHSYERAAKSYEPTISAYLEVGYKTCVIPKVSVQKRVEFILAQVETGA